MEMTKSCNDFIVKNLHIYWNTITHYAESAINKKLPDAEGKVLRNICDYNRDDYNLSNSQVMAYITYQYDFYRQKINDYIDSSMKEREVTK